MPWCPKCKTEYREGITVCPDCKTALVDELKEEDSYIPFFQAERKSIAEKLAKYFEYSNLKSSIKFDKTNQIYILSVPAEEQKQAKKLYQAFYFVERERHEKEIMEHEQHSEDDTNENTDVSDENISMEAPDMEQEVMEADSENNSYSQYAEASDEISGNSDYNDNTDQLTADPEGIESGADITETDPEPGEADYEAFDADAQIVDPDIEIYDDSWEDSPVKESKTSESSVYVMKADQYKDYSSTVWVFLITGVAGLVFVLLNAVKILTIFSGLFSNIIMALLFLFFIYIGLSTNNKAKKIQKEIDDENKLTDKINQWLKENVTQEFLASIRNNSVSEELNYINESEKIRNMLIEKFGDQNPAYLDRLVDDFYSANFDNCENSEDEK